MGYAWPAMVGMPFVAIGFLLLLAFHRRYE